MSDPFGMEQERAHRELIQALNGIEEAVLTLAGVLYMHTAIDTTMDHGIMASTMSEIRQAVRRDRR